ncbi:MAG TPA: class I SAM-dependent methyltransferase, partial [Acidimicrobiia bacterium]
MKSEFDNYASNYDSALNRGLAVSGESKDYFARQRVRWLAARLADLGVQPSRILDYGCGTGDT